MTTTRNWWKAPWRYAGLLLMGLAVIAGMTSGALAFGRLITVETAINAVAAFLVLLFLPGFVLHIIAIIRARSSNGA